MERVRAKKGISRAGDQMKAEDTVPLSQSVFEESYGEIDEENKSPQDGQQQDTRERSVNDYVTRIGSSILHSTIRLPIPYKYLRMVFQEMTSENDGVMNLKMFKAALKSFAAADFTNPIVLFKEFDTDGSGTLDWEEFVHLYQYAALFAIFA